MNPLEFAQIMVTVVGSVAGFVAIGLGARILWRMGSKQTGAVRDADPGRLQELERAVDAIAIEVERISEAQRFTVTLLAERLPVRTDDSLSAGAPRPLRARHDTPH